MDWNREVVSEGHWGMGENMKRKILHPIIIILAGFSATSRLRKGANDLKNKDGYTHISGKEAAKFVENAEKDATNYRCMRQGCVGEWVIFRSLYLYGTKTSIKGEMRNSLIRTRKSYFTAITVVWARVQSVAEKLPTYEFNGLQGMERAKL